MNTPQVQTADGDGNTKVVSLDSDEVEFGARGRYSDDEVPLPRGHHVYGVEDENGRLVGKGALTGGAEVDPLTDEEYEASKQRSKTGARRGSETVDGEKTDKKSDSSDGSEKANREARNKEVTKSKTESPS